MNNTPGAPLCRAGGLFSKRGVSEGHVLYVISQRAGKLLLGGRMIVDEIVPREDAVRRFKNDDLYPAGEWVIARQNSGTPLHLDRQLPLEVTRQLRFRSGKSGGIKGLLFVSAQNLNRQTTRIVRELTAESASILDKIIELSDK
jgi:hypothetical protein